MVPNSREVLMELYKRTLDEVKVFYVLMETICAEFEVISGVFVRLCLKGLITEMLSRGSQLTGKWDYVVFLGFFRLFGDSV